MCISFRVSLMSKSCTSLLSYKASNRNWALFVYYCSLVYILLLLFLSLFRTDILKWILLVMTSDANVYKTEISLSAID